MFGIGVTELLIFLVVGTLAVGLPLAVLFIVLASQRKDGSNNDQ
ncbi:MAG: hypothetical protein U0892_00540 [Pirellulales bacterium]